MAGIAWLTSQVVSPEAMRYVTVGDWAVASPWSIAGFQRGLNVTVADTGSSDFNFCLALHELVEAYLCTTAGISPETVDAYDLAYMGDEEPGDQPDCPYKRQHQLATVVELLVLHGLGHDVHAYETAVETTYAAV